MISYKSFSLTLLTWMLVLPLTAQTFLVHHGWQSLQQPADARTLALGQATLTHAGGAGSWLINPAIPQSETGSIHYGHQSRYGGIVQRDFLGWGTGPNRPWDLSLVREGVGAIPNTQQVLLDWGEDGIPNTGDAGEGNGLLDEGERLDHDQIRHFRQQQIGAYLVYRSVWRKFSVGVGVKSLVHILDSHTGLGLGLDVGLYRDLTQRISWGMSVYDVTTSWVVWDSGTREVTAPSLATGIGFHSKPSGRPIKFATEMDLVMHPGERTLSDDIQVGQNGLDMRAGLEIQYKEKLALRFGRDQTGSFQGGLGLAWTMVAIHYAYSASPPGSGLGISHTVSFTLQPDWLRSVAEQYL